jgi:pantoate--beta-alanine ligase
MLLSQIMQIIHTVAELRARLAQEKNNVFVPTMGNLHEGHIDLVYNAKPRGACTVVSIFVNRMQFGPSEDFNKYPRTLKDDCEKLQRAGCDIVFAPAEEEIYPQPQTYSVDPGPLGTIIEGAVRPGHFTGVATVVLKLFNLVQPKAAIFGKKDYQQCKVLQNMVAELALPIELILAETVRAPDGLALSSRNGYLSAAERAEAPHLHTALQSVKSGVEALLAGKALTAEDQERALLRMELEAMAGLAGRGWKPDYITVRRQHDLQPPQPGDRALVVLGAAKLGPPRLIDNLELQA